MAGRSEVLPSTVLMGWLGFFAGWTAGSIPLTLAGAPFSLLWVALGTGVLGAVTGALSGGALSTAPRTRPVTFQAPRRGEILFWMAGVGAFILAAGYFVKSSNALLLWCVAVGVSATALWASRRPTPPAPAGARAEPPAPLWGVGLLALGIILLYVVLHRPDADDSFYLNLPLGLLEPGAGMMVRDTMYGGVDWPILGSTYRVEALPTLIAALAWVTGLSVITIAHGVLPIVWCVTWALVLVLLGRNFAGTRWWIFACFSVLATLAFGGTLQTWGVHGVARLFHGKGPLLLVVVPLIVHVVLLNRRNALPTWNAWILLVLLEIAAIGLTANSIYIAPLTLGLALAATFIVQPDLRRSLILLTPAAFPLLAGLWIMFFDPPVVSGYGTGTRDLSLWDMASTKPSLALLLMTILGAALAARFVPGARIVTAFVLSGLILIVNPILWPIFDRHVTGGLGFRIWWALPVPMLLAVGLTWITGALPRPALAATAAGLGLAAMSLLPSGLVGMEETMLKPSLRKLPPEADLANRIASIARDTRTLAPEAIAAWLPIQDQRVPLVFSRRHYLDQNAQVVPADVLAPRILLADWIDGRATPSNIELEQALSKLCVKTLILQRPQPGEQFGSLRAVPVTDLGKYVVLKTDPTCD